MGTINKGSKNNNLTFQGPNQNIRSIARLLSVILIGCLTVTYSLISKGKLPDHLLRMRKYLTTETF